MSNQNTRQLVRIPYSYKGDHAIIKQQMDLSMQQTFKSIDAHLKFESDPQTIKKFKQNLKNRMQHYVVDCMNKFRSLNNIIDDQPKEQKKVIMSPDINLQKNNQIKSNLLKTGIQRFYKEPIPQINFDLKFQQPNQLNVNYCKGHSLNFMQAKKQLLKKNSYSTKNIQNVNFLEQLVNQAVGRFENQYQYDQNNRNLVLRDRK